MTRLLPRQHGFSFLEMVVALAVLAAVVAFLAPTVLSSLDATRSGTTLTEMAQIHEAILGDQRRTFGYVGDVGTYPASLADLVISNGAAGWSGPYLDNGRVVSNMLMDPYGQPYEFYLLPDVAGPDQLAIVSRGPDGLSTNTAPNPNVWDDFTGTAPSNAAYSAGTNNADNLVYPTPSATNANALNVNNDGTLALNLQNFDANTLVNAFVPACPNLYRVNVISQTRGTQEVTNLGYAPGFAVGLPQGPYRMVITAQNLSSAPVNENVISLPGQTVSRSQNLTGLDSSGTTQFVLTVTNRQPVELIEVYQFNTKLTAQTGGTTVPAAGGVRTFLVRACSQVYFKAAALTTIRDQMIMTWGATSRSVAGTGATLNVTNNYGERIRLFNNDVYFGEVKKGKTKSFTVGLLGGDVIKAYNKAISTLVKTQTLLVGANTMVVP